MEVAIVGDIKKDEAMRLAATYLGSLSQRAKMSGTTLDEVRKMKRPVGPVKDDKTIETTTPMALACIGFYGPDFENIAETRTMQAASRIMSTRMIQRVREKEQLAYSPQAGYRPAPEYPGFSSMIALMPTDPSKVDRVLELVPTMFADFAKDGPTEDEMSTVKKQMANTLDEQMKQPQFWVGQTGTLGYRGRTLDDVMAANDFYQGLTAEQIKTVFAKYYKPENTMMLSLRPAAKAGQKTEGAADAAKGEKK
jgi:zinc protease